MLCNILPNRSSNMDSEDDDFVNFKKKKVKRRRISKSIEDCDITTSTESSNTHYTGNSISAICNKNALHDDDDDSKLKRRSVQQGHRNKHKDRPSRKSVECITSSNDMLTHGIPASNNSVTNCAVPKSNSSSQQSEQGQRSHAPLLSISDLSPRAASTKLSDVSCGTKQKTVFEEHHKNGNRKADVGRCPFCQIPFQALVGQSPNWHTMECMDVPLKTTQECPAGLICDSTIPSHYRRYTHSALAFHLAGHQPCDHNDINYGKMTETIHDTDSRPSDSKATRTSQQSQKVKTSARQQKPKSASSKSKRKSSGSESELSQSQGSQKDSSIKMYFSPSGKSSFSTSLVKRLKKCSTVEEEELDPVLKLLISGSDSEEDIECNNTEDKSLENEEAENKTGDTPEDKILENGKLENLTGKNKRWENDDNGDEFNDELEFSEDDFADNEVKVDEEVIDDGDGFLQESEYESAAETRQNESISKKGVAPGGTLSSDHVSGTGSHQNFQFMSVYDPSSSVNTFSMQKQTSLFSFFKPHCHSVNNKDNQPSNSKNGSKLSHSKQGLRISNVKRDVQTKPVLSKRASEPVSLMRIPSPPPSGALKQRGSSANVSRLLATGGKPSAASTTAAATTSTSDVTSGRRGYQRQCPFYKKLTGTTITVDAFNYGEIPGCQAYVLTHFHYDHYQGLGKKFSQPIYCSPVTANLVEKQIGVASCWVNRLPLNIPSKVAGVWLTLMEANHCPGAVIILFELPNGKKLLHTGDFRADPCMEQYPPLINISVDELYLDTTYCNPSHAFPSQKDTIEFAVSVALKAKEREPGTLVVCGSYTIGKERIFIALAEALQSKVCVQAAKKRVLDCLEDDSLKNRLSLKWTDGCVHVLPMKQLNPRGLEGHLQQCPQFTSVLAFEPTGWTHSNKTMSLDTIRPKFSRHGVTLYGVPYSEHSSFLEMKRFVQFLRPKKILPTVNNGNPASRSKMEAIFKQWLSEKNTNNMKTLPKNNATTHQRSLGTWLKK